MSCQLTFVSFLAIRGATCYLNSFIQSLYMMPEFRSAVYEWKHNPETHKDEDTCIPLQMQKLFARLQVRRSVMAGGSMSIRCVRAAEREGRRADVWPDQELRLDGRRGVSAAGRAGDVPRAL